MDGEQHPEVVGSKVFCETVRQYCVLPSIQEICCTTFSILTPIQTLQLLKNRNKTLAANARLREHPRVRRKVLGVFPTSPILSPPKRMERKAPAPLRYLPDLGGIRKQGRGHYCVSFMFMKCTRCASIQNQVFASC